MFIKCYLREALKRAGAYTLSSLLTYSLDYLGFHYSPLQRLMRSKYVYYQLYEGTQFVVRPFTYDRCIIDEIFIDKVYTPSSDFVIKDDDIVVDLGAHIGVFTVFAAKQARNVKVYSYEPDPENFKLLLENLRLNRLEHKVKSFRLAISNARGAIPLYINDLGMSSLSSKSKRYLTVEAITLGDIFNLNSLDKIDFLKIDIEGAEWNVLKAAERNDYLNRIEKIAMECHSVKDTLRLKTLLKNFGFQVQIALGGHPTLFYLYARRN